jgi:hypothetical protein
MNRHVWMFRRLLRAYPSDFRLRYGDEMTRLFADQLRDAAGSQQAFAVARLWTASLIDVLMTAPGHHIGKEAPVAQPVDLASGAPAHGRSISPTQGLKLLLGLLPLWLLVVFQLAAPGYMEPAFANPPAVLGMPAGLVPLSVALALTAVGVVGLRRVSSTLAVTLVFLVSTVPAIFAVVLTPALVLILQN